MFILVAMLGGVVWVKHSCEQMAQGDMLGLINNKQILDASGCYIQEGAEEVISDNSMMSYVPATGVLGVPVLVNGENKLLLLTDDSAKFQTERA